MRVTEQILVFGEDENDRSAIIVLLRGLRPDLSGRVRIHPLRKPLTLVKNMDAARLVPRTRKVVAATRAANVALPVRACIFHEDTDAVEPCSGALAAQITTAYAGCAGVKVAAVAAWEVEAWWYLFPEAVVATHPSWQAPTRYVGRDTGKIRDPKKMLKRDVRPPGQRSSASSGTYDEKHSEVIARSIVDGGHLHRPQGTSASWTAFVAAVKAI